MGPLDRRERGPVSCSVVVATYNRRATLPGVIAPLLADPGTDELVVVVDGCRDGSMELLREQAAHEPRLVPVWIENCGTTAAQAAGARAASNDVLVLIDDDEIVEPGSIARLAAHHADHDELVVAGYVAMRFPERRRRGDFARYIYAKAYEADVSRWESDPDTVLRNLWGGFLSVRRTHFLRAVENGPPPIVGYHNDLDLGARLLELGLRGRFDRSARALHLYERDGEAALRDARSSGRNRVLVHRAHPDVLPPLTPALLQARASGPAKRVQDLLVDHASVRRLARVALEVSGWVHWWRAETGVAGLLWAAEQRRSVLRAFAHDGEATPL